MTIRKAEGGTDEEKEEEEEEEEEERNGALNCASPASQPTSISKLSRGNYRG